MGVVNIYTDRREVLVEDVDWLLSPMGGREHPEVVAHRLGMTCPALEMAMRRAGRPDLARAFSHIGGAS